MLLQDGQEWPEIWAHRKLTEKLIENDIYNFNKSIKSK